MLMMAISPNPFTKKLKILIIHRNEKVRVQRKCKWNCKQCDKLSVTIATNV